MTASPTITQANARQITRRVPEGFTDVHAVQAQIEQVLQGISENARLRTDSQFLQDALEQSVSTLAAHGGVIWQPTANGEFQALEMFGTEELDVTSESHLQPLAHFLTSAAPAPALIPPHAAGRNETPHLRILVPIVDGKRPLAIFEVLQRNVDDEAAHAGYIQFMQRVADSISRFLIRQTSRELEARTRWEALVDESVRHCTRNENGRTNANDIVNEFRRLLGCHRVTLVDGNRRRILAVSGSGDWNRRSPQLRQLLSLAVRSSKQAELEFTAESAPEDSRPLSRSLQKTWQKYQQLAPVRHLLILKAGLESRSLPLQIIVEQFHDNEISELQKVQTRQLAFRFGHCFALLGSRGSLAAPTANKALGVTALLQWSLRRALLLTILLGIIYPLGFMKSDLKVAARGKTIPTAQSQIFAPSQGIVKEVLVQHGQMVQQGQVIARLENDELQRKLVELSGQHSKDKEQWEALQRILLNSPRLAIEEQHRLAGEMQQLESAMASAAAQIESLEQQIAQLHVTSPIQGAVVTWDPQQRLGHRPVQMGQLLLRIADIEKPWNLELEVPETKIDKVLDKLSSDGSAPVTLTLLSMPGSYRGRVLEVENITHDDKSTGTQFVRVRVAFDEQPAGLRTETTAHAHIHCGEHVLGYVWFHEFVDTVQRTFFEWF